MYRYVSNRVPTFRIFLGTYYGNSLFKVSTILMLAVCAVDHSLVSFFFRGGDRYSVLRAYVRYSIGRDLSLLQLYKYNSVPIVQTPSRGKVARATTCRVNFVTYFFRCVRGYFHIFQCFRGRVAVLVFFCLFLAPGANARVSLLPIFFVFLLVDVLFPDGPSS